MVRQAVANGDAQSLGDITSSLRRSISGKILSTTFNRSGGGYTYGFSVLTDSGRFVDVTVDARTGAILTKRER